MNDIIKVYQDWILKEESISKEKLHLETRTRSLLHKIHKQLSDHYRDEEIKGAKQVLHRLSEANKAEKSYVKEAHVGSQASYYKLLEVSSSNGINRWNDKSQAILRFFNDYCGVNFTIDSENKLDFDEEGFPKFKISEVDIYKQENLKNIDKVQYVGYYWRSDNRIGIAKLELHGLDSKKGIYQKANMTFFYDTRTVNLQGEVEVPSPTNNDANIYIKLIDDKEQIEKNKNTAPIISNISIHIKDTSKKWSERQIMFGAYSSAHRKSPKHTYAGVFCFLDVKHHNIEDISTKTPVPDFVEYFLFNKRFQVPTDLVYNQSVSMAFSQSSLLKEVYVGVYKIYFINQKDKSLEVVIGEIYPSGKVVGKTIGRSNSKLVGQCICVKNQYLLINFQYRHDREEVHTYPLISYAAERSITDNCLYGVYSGIRSTQAPMSGRAFFEKVENGRYKSLKPKKLLFYDKDQKQEIETLLTDKKIIYNYLLGERNEQPSDRGILERYLKYDENQEKKDIHVDYDGEYKIYTLQIIRIGQPSIRQLKFSIYPLLIRKDGTVIVKGKREPAYEGSSAYDDGMLRVHITMPINLHLLAAYNLAEPERYNKGIVVRKAELFEGRAFILVKDELGSFDNGKYREDIDIWGEEAEEIDKSIDGGLSFLRGALNRYIILENKNDFRPRKKILRRLHFYSACYLNTVSPTETKIEIKRAYLHGFAARTYLGVDIYNDSYVGNEIVESIRGDWALLLKETAKGGLLSNPALISEIKQYWGDDYDVFPLKKEEGID